MNKSQSSNRDAAVSPSSEVVRDLSVFIDDSVSLFRPLTEKARIWLTENCPPGADRQYFGGALAVEARYVAGLLLRASEDGLEL
jgi:hypothetical protein